MHRILVALLALTIPAFASAEPATTQPGSVFQKLAERLPQTLTEDPSIKTFDYVGQVHADTFPVTVRVAQRSPEDRLICIAYAADGVPLLVAASNELMFYDTVQGKVHRWTNMQTRMDIYASGGTFTFNWGCDGAKAGKPAGVFSKLDVRSLFLGMDHDVDITREGAVDRITGHTLRGYVGKAWMDPAQAMPLKRMELFPNKQGIDPYFTIHRLSVNEPVDGPAFALPGEEEMAKVVHVQPPGKGLIDGLSLSVALPRAVLFRAALVDHKYRQAVEKYAGKVDWDERRKKDLELAGPLIKLLGDRIPTTQPAR